MTKHSNNNTFGTGELDVLEILSIVFLILIALIIVILYFRKKRIAKKHFKLKSHVIHQP